MDRTIERARDGDSAAVGELYEQHASRVYAIVRRVCGDAQQAEDLAHEAWVRVFTALPTFRGDSRFSTWLHRIAVNVALSDRRLRKRRPEAPLEESMLGSAGGERPMLRMRLEAAIDQLPPGMREVLVLHDVEGYKHREIAEMLGIAPGTCKSQLFKARARMRELLEPEAQRAAGEEVCST